MLRTSSLRMITTSSPANPTAAIVAIAYSAVAEPFVPQLLHAVSLGLCGTSSLSLAALVWARVASVAMCAARTP